MKIYPLKPAACGCLEFFHGTPLESRCEYNTVMARGWESKDVESRQEEFANRAQKKERREMTPEETAREAQRGGLLLDRIRLERDLAGARNPRYQEMVRESLKHIEEKLALLDADPLT
ncbi:MAG: hypothetical protein HYZ37_16810 [Candidatus Solibacter usitatus]|nr:hypothetical protein [Candidatus Solibacter usitatus]